MKLKQLLCFEIRKKMKNERELTSNALSMDVVD